VVAACSGPEPAGRQHLAPQRCYPRKIAKSHKIYSLIIAKWITKYSYSHKDYYYALFDNDPVNYSYKTGIREKDSLRRKADIREAMGAIEQVPAYVLSKAIGDRRSPK
jgi:hypothetical protein